MAAAERDEDEFLRALKVGQGGIPTDILAGFTTAERQAQTAVMARGGTVTLFDHRFENKTRIGAGKGK